MTFHSVLLELADIWTESTGRSAARLSTLVSKDGKTLGRITAGGSCTVTMFDRFVKFFAAAENWPDGEIPTSVEARLAQLRAVTTELDLLDGAA